MPYHPYSRAGTRRLGASRLGLAGRAARTVHALLPMVLAGCGGLEPVGIFTDTVTDPSRVYVALQLDYQALALSTAPGYETWQLTATPKNALGEAMTGLPSPAFRLLNLSDTNRLRVTPDGFLTALSAGTRVPVVADLLLPSDNVRHTDTAYVSVATTNPPPVLDSISDIPLDSGRYTITASGTGGTGSTNPPAYYLNFYPANNTLLAKPVTPKAWNTTGSQITGLSYEITSLDPEIATVTIASNRQTAKVVPLRPGQARIVARTTAYGITRVDTALYTVTKPTVNGVLFTSGFRPGDPEVFTPSEVTIRTYGYVAWTNKVRRAVDVTFDDPTNVVEGPAALCSFITLALGTTNHVPPPYCGSGDMTLTAVPDTGAVTYTAQYRQFPVAGTYPFHTSSGATGRVVVVEP